jgi:MGT family glycosyltransferase
MSKDKTNKKKFLIGTLPAFGHINPMIPVAKELVARGHDVRWYTGLKFQDNVEATGAHYLPMKAAPDLSPMIETEDYKKLKGIDSLKYDIRLFLDSVPGQVEDITEILNKFQADVILSDSTFLGASYFSEKGILPWAVLGINPLIVPSKDAAPFGLGIQPDSSMLGRLRNRFLDWFVNHIVLRDINAHMNRIRKKMGLPLTTHPLFDPATVKLFSLFLQTTTPAFEYPRSDLPDQVHFIGPIINKPPEEFDLPSWWDELKSDKPVVLVTQGTVATDHNRLLIPSLRALKDEDVLVFALTGGKPAESISIKPANARIKQYLPFSQYCHLLDHVDVMITNGGYGGVQFALSHGVPLIVAGNSEEKAEVCAHVAWSGAGINLKTDSPKEAQIKNAVKSILSNPKYKERANQIKEDFSKYDAPKRAVQLLEQLAETKKPVLRKD